MESDIPTEPTELVRRHRPAGLFLHRKLSTSVFILASLLCAFVMFNWVAEDQQQNAQVRFNELGQQIAVSLERQISRTEDALTSIVALFAASDGVSRQQFKTFVSNAMSDQTGIQALEWIPRIPDLERVTYELAAKADGLLDFSIRQAGDSGMITAAVRDEYYPVYYVEPLAGNEKAVGFDLASNPARKAALEQARDTDAIVSSARIILVQESAKQAGVVVFAPMYRPGASLYTFTQRHDALTGFGLGVFRIGDLLESSVSDVIRTNEHIIALYDVTDKNNRQPLHIMNSDETESDVYMDELSGEKSFHHNLKFGGRDWRFVFAPKGGNLSVEHPSYPWLAAIAVLLVISLVGLYFTMTVQRSAYAQQIALSQELAEARDKAEEANWAKSNFLNIMSHELRTPLTVILGYTPILTSPKNIPSVKRLMQSLENKSAKQSEIEGYLGEVFDDIAKYAGKMTSSGQHLLLLINDMLDLSKIEAGKMEIYPESISVDATVRSVVDQLIKSAEDKDLQLLYETHGETVIAEEIRLKQILINLIGNSIKFTDVGSIKVITKRRGSFVEFTVTDTGCGIPEDEFGEVFERFNQADDSATRKARGTGLGLSIARSLVELHGGEISVSSKLHAGSTFCFTIPVEQ